MPSGLPDRSLVAKLPSVQTTRGRINSTCLSRYPWQASISSGWGSRFPAGTAAAAATTAHHCALRAGGGKRREQACDRRLAAFGAPHAGLIAGRDQLLERSGATGAEVLVDRHGPSIPSESPVGDRQQSPY